MFYFRGLQMLVIADILWTELNNPKIEIAIDLLYIVNRTWDVITSDLVAAVQHFRYQPTPIYGVDFEFIELGDPENIGVALGILSACLHFYNLFNAVKPVL